MNRLTFLLAQDGHLRLKQKLRSLVMMVFGHTALFPMTAIHKKRGHCGVFEIEIERLENLPKKSLAMRKLLNPFKWLEFIVILPFELLNWAIQHSAFALDRAYPYDEKKPKRNAIVALCGTFALFVLTPISLLVTNSVLAIPRRMLAPARYIIRPAIDMAKTKPFLFAMVTGVSLSTLAVSLCFLFGPFSPIALPLISIAAVVLAKTGIAALTAITVFCTSLRATQVINDIKDAKKHLDTPNDQLSISNKNKRKPRSTSRISEALHGLNPKLTIVNEPGNQKFRHTLALATGTESVFFPARDKTRSDGKLLGNGAAGPAGTQFIRRA